MILDYILQELQWRLKNPSVIDFKQEKTLQTVKEILLEITDDNKLIDECITNLREAESDELLQHTIKNPKTGNDIKIATALQFDPNGNDSEIYNIAKFELEKLHMEKKKEAEFIKNKKNKNILTVGDKQYDKNFMSDGEIEHLQDKLADEKIDTQNKETNVLYNQKDKTLVPVNTKESALYTEQISPTEEEFAKLNIEKIEPAYSFQNYNLQLVPQKYIKALERMLNYNGKNKNMHQIKNIINTAGAGDIQSQAGELMTLVLCSLQADEANKLTKELVAHIKQTGNKSVLTHDWVTAANNCANAFRVRIKKQYGEKATIDALSWDNENDVSQLGLLDYKQNKGFSSDIYVKILVDGKYILDEPSLKKDDVVNLWNGSVGEFTKYTDELPSNVDVNIFKEKRKLQFEDFLKANEDNVINNIQLSDLDSDEFKEAIDDIAKGNAKIDTYKKELTEFFAKLQDAINNKKANETLIDIIRSSKFLGTKNKKGEEVPSKDQRHINKYILLSIQLSAKLGDVKSDKFVNQHLQESRGFAKNATLAIASNKEIKFGVINSIRENLPIKSIASAEESMCIGSLSLDMFTLEKMFGTTDYEKIADKLEIGGDDENPTINYIADVEGIKKNIKIANIKIREDGMGYGGIFKFEMKLNSNFATNLYKAHVEVYGAESINAKDTKKFEQRIKNQEL